MRRRAARHALVPARRYTAAKITANAVIGTHRSLVQAAQRRIQTPSLPGMVRVAQTSECAIGGGGKRESRDSGLDAFASPLNDSVMVAAREYRRQRPRTRERSLIGIPVALRYKVSP